MNKTIHDFVFFGSQLLIAAATTMRVILPLGNDGTTLVSASKRQVDDKQVENENFKNLTKIPSQISTVKQTNQVEKTVLRKFKRFSETLVAGLASEYHPSYSASSLPCSSKPNFQDHQTEKQISFGNDQLTKIQTQRQNGVNSSSFANLTDHALAKRSSIKEKNRHHQVYSNTASEYFTITNEGALTSLTSKGKNEIKLTIPENVVKILANAFAGCNKNLETIDIESKNLTIDPAALKAIPAKTNFRVATDAIRDNLIRHGIEGNRISILSQGYNWNTIIIASLATLLVGGIIFKVVHILIKRHRKKNKEKSEA